MIIDDRSAPTGLEDWTSDLWFRSRNSEWALLSFQPFHCRPFRFISADSGPFSPDLAPGFAPEVGRKPPDPSSRIGSVCPTARVLINDWSASPSRVIF